MDRTVPSSATEDLALYIRTYYSLLRSSREVQIRTLIEAHTRTNSALHVDALSSQPDMAAFIYAVLRLPPQIVDQVRLVVLGQSEQMFAEMGYRDVESWERVSAPARRRRVFFDGTETLAVFIASRSDIDDIIPTLTALQIERDKLHRLLEGPRTRAFLADRTGRSLSDDDLQGLANLTGIDADDLDRLRSIWKQALAERLLALARRRVLYAVRLLSGSLADYRRATRRWWQNATRNLQDVHFEDRPVYFVSSNTHSLANSLSGFALLEKKALIDYVVREGAPDLRQEYEDIRASNVPSNSENFLYYTLKKAEAAMPAMAERRLTHESRVGIHRLPSRHAFDVEMQVAELNRLDPTGIDPRLRLPGIETLRKSKALIINIDFPLGMAAYQILSEVARNIAAIRGVYIMGKAATLNGRIGDVMIPDVVHDEHSRNTYLFDNCLHADDVAPLLVYGNVLDNQKAITVLGTFLQNRDYMSVFYHEGYTDMEMEAGPFLGSIYEMVRPQRHPTNEVVDLHRSPFPIGFIHYASDTPFSKGKNLGSQNLSYFGMDATYASTIAVLRAIIGEEIRQQQNAKHHDEGALE